MVSDVVVWGVIESDSPITCPIVSDEVVDGVIESDSSTDTCPLLSMMADVTLRDTLEVVGSAIRE